MTDIEAQAEAKRRWGRAGKAWRVNPIEDAVAQVIHHVNSEAPGPFVTQPALPYRVGFKPNLGRGRIGQRYYRQMGRGETWEAAFADAAHKLPPGGT